MSLFLEIYRLWITSRYANSSCVRIWPYLATCWPPETAKEIKKFPVVCIYAHSSHGGSKVQSSVISESSKPSSRNAHAALAATTALAVQLQYALLLSHHCKIIHDVADQSLRRIYQMLFRLIDASEGWNYQETETIFLFELSARICRCSSLHRRVGATKIQLNGTTKVTLKINRRASRPSVNLIYLLAPARLQS